MKILIRLPNWLGDVVMSTAFIASLKGQYPEAVVDVIIKKELSALSGMIAGINTFFPFSKTEYKGLIGAYRFGNKLKTESYDLFFNLPVSISSIVMGWATGAKRRIGFKIGGSTLLFTDTVKKPENIHRVDEYIALLEAFTGKVIRDRQVALKIDTPGTLIKNNVIINFNSEASSRRMPVDKGRSIINSLTSSFPNRKFSFIGAPKETAFIDEIIAGAENKEQIENLAGTTKLTGLADLIADSPVFITTDSGPAHLANALGVPTIVLFGAGNEHNTAPYNKQNLTVLRYGQLACEPCVKNTCKLYGTPKCMLLLDEQRIVNELGVYLKDE